MVKEQYIAVSNATGIETAIHDDLDMLLTMTHNGDYTIKKVVPLHAEIEQSELYYIKRGNGIHDYLNFDTDDLDVYFDDASDAVGFKTRFTKTEIHMIQRIHNWLDLSKLKMVLVDED